MRRNDFPLDSMPPPPPVLGVRFYKIVLAVLLLGGIWLGTEYGYRRAEERRVDRMYEEAWGLLEEGRLEAAAEEGSRLVRVSSGRPGVLRLMATVAEEAGLPEEIAWRRRIFEGSDDKVSSGMELARAALRHGELGTADRALLAVRELSGAPGPDYWDLAATLAVETGHPVLAAHYLDRALEVEPTDVRLALNRAALELREAAPEREGPRRRMEDLVDVPGVGAAARRHLMTDAVRRGDRLAALRHAEALEAGEPGDFGVALDVLGVFRWADHRDWRVRLRRLQNAVSGRPAEVFALLHWMNGHGLALEALSWNRSLEPGEADRLWLDVVRAESLAVAKSWLTLRGEVAGVDWQGLEFLRLAYYAKGLVESEFPEESQSAWTGAVEAAGKNPEALRILARLAWGWGWEREAETLYWELAGGAAYQDWALGRLFALHRTSGDLEALYRVAEMIVGRSPRHPLARHNLAVFGMLLERDLRRAHDLARENAEREPGNVMFAVAHAYALFQQGRGDEALALLGAQPADRLAVPNLALYGGVIAAHEGRRRLAGDYLEVAGRGRTFLPAEESLLREARRRVLHDF